MDQFVVSARKYRPATFSTVVGQSSITGTLKNAIRNQHLAQAFLFCGPRGVGKTTCARILAKTINCTNLTADIEGCNECDSCKAFNEGQSLNIFELDGASNNGVEEMRNLVEKVRYPPQSGKYKVYIIDEVHMLSVPAFNAFLKTLEEPPSYAVFILATTEKHKIIPTILSRCQIFDFNRITVEDIADHLQYISDNEHVKAEPEALHLIAQKADGALRDALSIFDQIVSYAGDSVTYKDVIDNLNILDYEYYFRVTDYIRSGDYVQSLLLLNEIISDGFELHHFVSGLASHFRDLLVCKEPNTLSLLEVGGNIKEKYKAQSQQCSSGQLFRYLDIANKCDFEFKLAQNQRLHTEIALMKMCAVQNQQDFSISTSSESGKKKVEVKTPSTSKAEIQTNGQADPGKIENAGTAAETSKVIPVTQIEPPEKKSVPIVPEQTDMKPKTGTRTGRKRTATVSISDKFVVKPDEPSEVKEEKNLPAEAVSQSQIEEVIRVYVQKLSDEGRKQYSVALGKYAPMLKEENIIEIPVDNAILSDEIQQNKPELLGYVREKLSNYSLQITQRVVSEQEVKSVPYTPAEKFIQMAEKNPELNKLKQQFDLELDF